MQFLKPLKAGVFAFLVGASLSNASPFVKGSYPWISARQTQIPTIVLAGVTVPNTPIVQAAQAYARAHADDMTFNHVMRSWLFGSIMINKTTAATGVAFDPEVHAVAAILHDLGWDKTGELISKDKRFEVDGAIAAWNFIEAAVNNGTADNDWDENRKQLVWDSIALHTTPQISAYKQPVVALTGFGILSDFQGPHSNCCDPEHLLTWDEYNTIKEAFPRLDLGPSVSKIACGIAKTKPATTFDNWMMTYGFHYVENYTQEAKGHLTIDLVESALPN
ncbi:hypothetical protein G7Y89_g11296 [Cudoniella acicularis]|uniref:HD domain-containing protein n=1 Tax=Cudoniella acicularis TaxID=354080 RepID=A0A8H4VY59_9HELO|nr:hypothetical protein G7Y89_g11296 [Cudoniella acicularis]